ncbi:DUF6415 family natural product biosynthesis protein [Streptomyces sp. NPDC002055]|uniref:DUF6415 family natural product biosynthesis protein n=1 Tax=Streptomyces sp. NPDC002055 TaxID=3154534 RepID=UPI00331A2B71
MLGTGEGSIHQGPGPIDEATIQDTIVRSLRTASGRIDMAELVRLDELLRGHIALLFPGVEASTDRLWRGSVAWYQRRAGLDRIRRQVAEGLGEGPLSAHIQVTALARDCQWLLTQHREERP